MGATLRLLIASVALLALGGCNRVELDRDDVRELARAGRELVQELSGEATAPLPPRASRPPPAPTPPPAAPEQAPTYYRYTDETGSMHFVSSLEEVPASLRDRARPAGGSFTRTSSGSGRAATRSFAKAGPAPARHHHADVIVYTAPWCGWCRKTLSWLDARQVPYDNRDIEQDDRHRRELIAKSGRSSIPFVEIDGETISGYSPERMARLLDR